MHYPCSAVLWLYRSTVPAWSMQTDMAATHHAVLERMSTSAFASVVPTALLTRVLLVFPSYALFVIVVSRPPRLPHLGNSKGMLGYA